MAYVTAVAAAGAAQRRLARVRVGAARCRLGLGVTARTAYKRPAWRVPAGYGPKSVPFFLNNSGVQKKKEKEY